MTSSETPLPEKGTVFLIYFKTEVVTLNEHNLIDNKRCPIAAKEFLDYEYERDKEGNVISGYPDGNDHTIDAVRYATERIWRRRGQ